jgi:hypothetical protein
MDEESQARGGRNSRTVEFQLQARIECDPKNGVAFFTRCTVHLQPFDARYSLKG